MAVGKKLLLSLSVFAIRQRKRLPDTAPDTDKGRDTVRDPGFHITPDYISQQPLH